MDLTELRNRIDRVDEQLIPLLLERMELSEKVADIKAKMNIPVLNEEREREILEKVAEKCGGRGDAVRAVYAAILEASKDVQKRIIGE
jgi:monofunctional chorismate mutase